jgi:hypothetical protein
MLTDFVLSTVPRTLSTDFVLTVIKPHPLDLLDLLDLLVMHHSQLHSLIRSSIRSCAPTSCDSCYLRARTSSDDKAVRHRGVAAGTPTPPRFACHFALVGQRRRPLKRTASQLMDARCDDEGGASGAPVQVAVVVAPNLVCGAGGPACECARLRVLFRRMRVWPRSASLCAPLTLDVERRPILCDLKSAALVPRRAYANRDILGGRQVVRLRRR